MRTSSKLRQLPTPLHGIGTDSAHTAGTLARTGEPSEGLSCHHGQFFAERIRRGT